MPNETKLMPKETKLMSKEAYCLSYLLLLAGVILEGAAKDTAENTKHCTGNTRWRNFSNVSAAVNSQ